MLVLGHRGSPGYPRFGENTRDSFQKALDAGAAGFELDVRRCRDGTIVVIHDATIDRTTNGSGAVSRFSSEQLLDHGIPRLTDVLDEFGGRCVIHVELKEPGLGREVAHLIGQRKLTNDVVVSSFPPHWPDLKRIAAVVPTALIVDRPAIQDLGYSGFINAARDCGAKAIHPSRNATTPELITLAHGAGFIVRVWTVNEPAEARRWRDWGVDAIFSDCPGAMYTLDPDAI